MMELREKAVKLTPRLELIAGLVKQGSILADVGTDHAYLPVALVQRGVCPKAYACDVVPGPLEHAERNIARYGLKDRIQTVLADGLQGVEQSDVDTVVIAGMGGETISSILAASRLAASGRAELLLQPMTAYPELKRYLKGNGFCVAGEWPCREENRYYTVLRVVRGAEPHPQPLYEWIGWHILTGKEPLYQAYRLHLVKRYRSILCGLQQAEWPDEDKLQAVNMVVEELERIRKEELHEGK